MRNRMVLCLWLAFFGAISLGAAGAQTAADSFEIDARNKEYKGDLVLLTGDVRIIYKNIRLFADYVSLNIKTKDVHAHGNVTVHLPPDEVISMEELNFNLESGQGDLKNAHGLVQPSITYKAETMQRENDDLYRLQGAWVTSCTQTSPRWTFTCSRANLKKDDYVEMWNSVFRIKKIPVFYLPYMRYPLDSERSTGFLIPQLGINARKGLTYSQGFYLAIRRNMDATLNFDYYSRRGMGGGLEYRYLFPKGTGGQLNLFYFLFKDIKEEGVILPSNAYIIRMNHTQTLPLDFRLVADVDYQSSFDFLREFDDNFRRAVVSNRRSQIYVSRAWGTYNFTAQISQFESYFSQLNRAIVKKNFPLFNFSSSKVKIFEPFYFSFDSSLYGWQYGYDSSFKQGNQKRGSSLSFSPALTVPFKTIPWLTINSTLGSQFSYYFQSYLPNTATRSTEDLLARNYSVNLEAIGPVFYRIFNNSEDEPVMKHIIEPNYIYRYESPVASSDRIVTQRFFILNHYFQYGITNRFLVKRKGMTREIMSLRFSQTFYLDPDNSPLQAYRINGEIPEFSDIGGEFRFYPSSKHSLDFSAGLNPYHWTLSRIRLGGSFGSTTDNIFLRISWYKSANPYYESLLARNQITFISGLKIPRLSLELMGDIDFNIQERELLYSAVSLIYHYQCLDFIFDFKVFYFRDKPEMQFRFNFGLGNIGKTTDFFGGGRF